MSAMFIDNHRQHHRRFNWLLAGLVVLILILMVCVGVLLWKCNNVQKKTEPSNEPTGQTVISKVNKIYMLPAGEEPTVAQIKDKTKLAGDQQFYKYAKDGDYVLVYSKAKLAILYRESDNRLISVMPISVDQKGSSNTPDSSQP